MRPQPGDPPRTVLAVALALACTGAPAGPTSLGPFHLGAEVHDRVRLKLALQPGGRAAPQQLELGGRWTATVTDIHDGLAEVARDLADVQVVLRDGAHEQGGEELASELGRRFFVTHGPDGRAVAVWLPRNTRPAIANILLTLAGASQLVRPGPAQPAWIVQERDVNGEYTAAYQEIEPGRFTKQKGRYVQPASTAAAPPAVRIEHSRYDLRADRAGRILELDADENLTVQIGGLSFNLTMTLALREPRTRQAPELIGAFARERSRLESYPMEQLGMDAKAELARRDRAVLAGASWDSLLARLRALPTETSGSREEARSLLDSLEALFRLDPDTPGRAPAAVQGEDAERGKILVDALSAAQTDAAQAALATVASDPAAPTTLRRYAVQYLALQEAPAEAPVAALSALIDTADPQLAQMAALAYGACARRLRPVARSRAAVITGELVRRFARAAEPNRRADLVVALGNTGDPAALPTLRALTEGGPLRVRTRAIHALRFIDDPAIDPLLTSLLQKAPEESVRMAVLDAIRFRQVGPFTMVLADVARKDAAPGVRHAAIDLLGSRLKELPGLRVVLEQAAKSDAVARNRELAARYLGG